MAQGLALAAVLPCFAFLLASLVSYMPLAYEGLPIYRWSPCKLPNQRIVCASVSCPLLRSLRRIWTLRIPARPRPRRLFGSPRVGGVAGASSKLTLEIVCVRLAINDGGLGSVADIVSASARVLCQL